MALFLSYAERNCVSLYLHYMALVYTIAVHLLTLYGLVTPSADLFLTDTTTELYLLRVCVLALTPSIDYALTSIHRLEGHADKLNYGTIWTTATALCYDN